MAIDEALNHDPDLAADGDATRDAVETEGGDGDGKNSGVYDDIEVDRQLVDIGEGDIWADKGGGGEEDCLLLDPSIFYPEFPPLPEFPCMSASAPSSPSTPWPPVPSSSSSAGSSSPWNMMRSNPRDGGAGVAAPSSTGSMEIPPPTADQDDLDGCIDVMEHLGSMDFMDPNEMWDPSCLFQTDDLVEDRPPGTDGLASFLHGNTELAVIFFEWLKQNRDHISAEDVRSIKLKKSTVETASSRLGTNPEGKKQLLKLILQWVEQYQLQKKPSGQNQNPNPSPNCPYTPMNLDPTACYSTTPAWLPPPQTPPQPPQMPITGYATDPYGNPIYDAHYLNQPSYPLVELVQPLLPVMAVAHQQYGQYPENVNNNVVNHQMGVDGNNLHFHMGDGSEDRAVSLGPSTTKEARKKRMARQRRLHAHRHRFGGKSSHLHSHMGDGHVEGVFDGGDGYCLLENWAYWEAMGSSYPVDGDQMTKMSGLKVEKNFKFLLQKVLKQSDVGNLGRIVLPKKEAETHLPELESRDGIPIAIEEIGTSRVWNMRYRFWPNNKSRMYLLENTGDFVRVNGLQEGDFIVIYLNTKYGKYMIRGVKVPQPGTKRKGQKLTKNSMRNNTSHAGHTNPPIAPIKHAVR